MYAVSGSQSGATLQVRALSTICTKNLTYTKNLIFLPSRAL